MTRDALASVGRAWSFLFLDEGKPSGEDMDASVEATRQWSSRLLSFGGPIGLSFHFVMTIVDLNFAGSDTLPFLAAHFLFFLLFFVQRRYLEHGLISTVFTLVLQSLTTFPYMWALSLRIGDVPTLQVFVLWTVILSTTFFCVIFSPAGVLTPVIALVFSATAGWVWRSRPDGHTLFAIHTASLAFAFFLNRGLCKSRRVMALFELQRRRFALAADQARIRRELALASEIQDSQRPGDHLVTPELELTFLLRKHDSVGGDWFAHRTDGSGRHFIFICDVAGKGLRAGIVLHALQSLWAESLGLSVFEPAEWFARANGCLLSMGDRSRHVATGAIAQIEAGRITYWNAAHVPAFLLTSADERSKVVALAPRGSLIGHSRNFHAGSRTHDFSAGAFLLLGSDGVFSKGIRHTTQEILQLVAGAQAEGAAVLDRVGVEDDKALVVVRKLGSPG